MEFWFTQLYDIFDLVIWIDFVKKELDWKKSIYYKNIITEPFSIVNLPVTKCKTFSAESVYLNDTLLSI